MPIALAGLRLTELGVEKPREIVTEARRSREAATGAGRLGEVVIAEAKKSASLLLSIFLSLLAFFLSLAFLAFR